MTLVGTGTEMHNGAEVTMPNANGAALNNGDVGHLSVHLPPTLLGSQPRNKETAADVEVEGEENDWHVNGEALAQVTMFNESRGPGAQHSARLGENSSDYAGCWHGGICCVRLTPCGDGCIHGCYCVCGIPVTCVPWPICCCVHWYTVGDSKGEFKDMFEKKDGGKDVMYMVDKNTIKFRPSTNPKDCTIGIVDAALWGTTRDGRMRGAMECHNAMERDNACCGCMHTFTKIC